MCLNIEISLNHSLSLLGDISPPALNTGMVTDTGVIRAKVETLKSFYTTPLPITPQSEIPGTRLPPLPRCRCCYTVDLSTHLPPL